MLVVDREVDPDGLLATAALASVIVVDFDSGIDSTEVFVSKIERAYEANGGTPLTAVAFANHGGVEWQLTTDCICHPTHDDEAEDYLIAAAPVLSALAKCTAEGGRIDLLGCRLLTLDERLPDKLEKMFEGIQFTASDDDTGNPRAGGDWIMESDGLDISTDYFDPVKLKEYNDTMWGFWDVIDMIPIVGSVARAGQLGVLLVKGDTEGAKEAALNLAMNVAGDAMMLVSGPGGKAAMTSAKTAVKAGAKAGAKAVVKGGVKFTSKAGAKIFLKTAVKSAAPAFIRTFKKKMTKALAWRTIKKKCVKKLKKGPRKVVKALWNKTLEEGELPDELDFIVGAVHNATGIDVNELDNMSGTDFLELFSAVGTVTEQEIENEYAMDTAKELAFGSSQAFHRASIAALSNTMIGSIQGPLPDYPLILNVPDAARQYSSIYNNDASGTGHGQSKIDSPQGWSAWPSCRGEYVQMDIGSDQLVAGVVIQARAAPSQSQHVTKFLVSYMDSDDDHFMRLPNPNDATHSDCFTVGPYEAGDADAKLTFNFPGGPVTARFVRVEPWDWVGHPSMRIAPIVVRERCVVNVPEESRTYSSVFDQADVQQVAAAHGNHILLGCNPQGDIFHRVGGEMGGSWLKLDGALTQVAICPVEGEFFIGCNAAGEVWHRAGLHGSWQRLDGTPNLKQVATSRGGESFVGVTAAGEIWHRAGVQGSWQQLDGGLTQVAISCDGNFIIGCNAAGEVYHRAGVQGSWHKMDGVLTQVAVSGTQNTIIGLNAAGDIYYRAQNGRSAPYWRRLDGRLNQVTISEQGPGGQLFFSGCNGGGKVHHRAGGLAADYESAGRSGSWQVFDGGSGHAQSQIDSAGAWSAGRNKPGEWMQMDLGEVRQVTGVVTQGRHEGGDAAPPNGTPPTNSYLSCRQKVVDFKVQYSLDNVNFFEVYVDYQYPGPGPWSPPLRADECHAKYCADFPNPVSARYVRLVASTWYGHISMRAALQVVTREPLFERGDRCLAEFSPDVWVPATVLEVVPDGLHYEIEFRHLGHVRTRKMIAHQVRRLK